MPVRRAPVLASALAAVSAACGSSNLPTAPTPTTTPPVQTFTVNATVFYDANGNGVMDSNELGRVPAVRLTVGGQSAFSSNSTGQAAIAGVPAGSYSITVQTDSLPPYYTSGPLPTVTVPQTAPVMVPVTLSIGANRPGTYMAFGDSITDGDGSSDEAGYRDRLQAKLKSYFGEGVIVNEAIGGTTSDKGAARIQDSLNRTHTAYALIMYGTNDWNKGPCQDELDGCFTIPSLTSMIEDVKAAHTLPFVCTILPVNTGYDFRTPDSRNDWVHAMDQQIRALIRREGAVLVDTEAAFLNAPVDFHLLLSDHVHPNDKGYDIMAATFFDAISHGKVGAGASLEPPPLFGLVAPGDLAPAPERPAPAETGPRRSGDLDTTKREVRVR